MSAEDPDIMRRVRAAERETLIAIHRKEHAKYKREHGIWIGLVLQMLDLNREYDTRTEGQRKPAFRKLLRLVGGRFKRINQEVVTAAGSRDIRS